MSLLGRLIPSREKTLERRYQQLKERYRLTNFSPTRMALELTFLKYPPIPLQPDEMFLGAIYTMLEQEINGRVELVRNLLALTDEKGVPYANVLEKRRTDMEKFYQDSTSTFLKLRGSFDDARLNSKLEGLATALNDGFEALKQLVPTYNNISKDVFTFIPPHKSIGIGFRR